MMIRRVGRTGWLLVLVYLGGLAAISDFIAGWILFSQELLFYEVFFKVIVSTVILYALAQIYGTLRDKPSSLTWWNRGIRILAFIFGIIGFSYVIVGLGQYFLVDALKEDQEFKNLDSEVQRSIIQEASLFLILLVLASIIAFTATLGLSLHRKFGWYAAVSLVLIQILAITGLLNKERATQFVLPPEIVNQLTAVELHQVETDLVPLLMDGVFAMLVANIVIVTFLTLPQILVIFKMPPDILSARIGKDH
jgi:hypothetical protein